MIKLSKLIFAFSFLFLLAACGDDDPATPTTDDLIGTWTAVSFNADIETTTTGQGTNISSTASFEGSDFDYDLTFDETNFNTTGGYVATSEITVDGTDFPTSTTSYSNISGSGTYSTDGDQMTVSGSFFSFSANGMDFSSMSQDQTVEFEINSNGELVFTQNETLTDVQAGFNVTTKVVSSSTWVKK